MLNHTFTFNGHSSDEFGIKIERFRNPNRPARKYQAASVAGRNGNMYRLENAWEEVLVSYEIFAEASVGDTEADIDKENGTYFTWTADGLTINGTIPAVIQEEVGKLIATRNRTILVQGGTAGTYALTCRVERDGVTLRMEVITTGSETFVLSAGDELYIDLSADGTFNNFVTPFKIIDAEILDLPKKWTNIMEWLNSVDGYAHLTDTYDPTHYYEAVFVDALDIANSWNQFGRAIVSFRCRPERFLTSNAQIRINGGIEVTINNPTNHIAKPLVCITRATTAGAYITINDVTITISEPFNNDCYIDCETENIYGTARNNMNNIATVTRNGVVTPDFLKLVPGDNTVYVSSANDGWIVEPRFWEL